MLESITQAAENFCMHQLGAAVTIEESKEIEDGALLAYIDIKEETGSNFRVYLIAQKEFVQFVAEVFLDETQSDEATIKDMALECTNLIVGSAKVIAEQNGVHFNISTPKLQDAMKMNETFDEIKKIICNGNALYIALKATE